MKRVSTDGDRRYAVWAIQRALVALTGKDGLSVPEQAEKAIGAIQAAKSGEELCQVFRERIRELQFLRWNDPFDRELAVLVASALGLACGCADSDRGMTDALVVMARMQARLTAIAGRSDVHQAVYGAELLERHAIATARSEFAALAELPSHA